MLINKYNNTDIETLVLTLTAFVVDLEKNKQVLISLVIYACSYIALCSD